MRNIWRDVTMYSIIRNYTFTYSITIIKKGWNHASDLLICNIAYFIEISAWNLRRQKFRFGDRDRVNPEDANSDIITSIINFPKYSPLDSSVGLVKNYQLSKNYIFFKCHAFLLCLIELNLLFSVPNDSMKSKSHDSRFWHIVKYLEQN